MEASGSLTEQLRWIRDQWGFVAERFGDRMVISLDVLNEEERAMWMRFNATHGGAGRRRHDADTAALHGFDTGDAARRPRGGALQHGPRLDAARRAHRQDHLRLA